MGALWYSKKWVTVLLHAAAWLFLFSLPFLLRPSMNSPKPSTEEQHTATIILRYILNDIMYIGFFYLNAGFLIPKFIYRRKYKEYALAVAVSFLLLLVIGWLLTFGIMDQRGFNLSGHILFNFFFFLFFFAGSTAYKLTMDRARADRIAREKQTENLKTELSLLRSQASPHFMFNVLNNMVALARKKSDLLEPSLLKFSSLMRYMLYDADEEKVLLDKEVEYLQSYIDLQQQRFGKNVHVNVSLQKVDTNYEIEPMLLIPFVENAFKHGVGLIDKPEINIELNIKENVLHFFVQNKYSTMNVAKDKTSGIGLANVKRRLELLYGKDHALNIDKNGNLYSVSLQIKLK